MSVLRISPEFRPAYDPLLRWRLRWVISMSTQPALCSPNCGACSLHGRRSTGFARSFRRIAMNRFGANLRARSGIHSSIV